MKNKRPSRQGQNKQNQEFKREEKPREKAVVAPEEMENLFEGRNAVLELLNTEKTIHKLFVKSGEPDGSLRVILAKAKERGIIVQQIPKDKLDEISETGRHQGVVALCPPFEYAELGEVLRHCARVGENPFIVVLDKIFDPHNFGAIIRTAAACGVHGIIIPKRRSVGITAAVVRASAGAAAKMPIIRVANIAQTLEILKKAGIWIAGAEADGDLMYNAPLTGALAVVIGNEDEGISRLVKEKCDFLVSVPMPGEMSSLNASVAAGVVMYEVVRRKMNVSK